MRKIDYYIDLVCEIISLCESLYLHDMDHAMFRGGDGGSSSTGEKAGKGGEVNIVAGRDFIVGAIN